MSVEDAAMEGHSEADPCLCTFSPNPAIETRWLLLFQAL